MPKKDKEYRLCYVRDGVMFFMAIGASAGEKARNRLEEYVVDYMEQKKFEEMQE